MNPVSRKRSLLIEEVAGELVIYDRATYRAHCLNRTAALIWRACDGTRDVEGLATLLHEESGLPRDADLVRLTLARLGAAGLLEERVERPPAGVTRRTVIRRLGLTGPLLALLPSLQSVSAAAAGALGSCIPSGKCIAGLTECNPCHQGDPATQCATKVCRGFNCINVGSTNCRGSNPATVAPNGRSPRRR